MRDFIVIIMFIFYLWCLGLKVLTKYVENRRQPNLLHELILFVIFPAACVCEKGTKKKQSNEKTCSKEYFFQGRRKTTIKYDIWRKWNFSISSSSLYHVHQLLSPCAHSPLVSVLFYCFVLVQYPWSKMCRGKVKKNPKEKKTFFYPFSIYRPLLACTRDCLRMQKRESVCVSPYIMLGSCIIYDHRSSYKAYIICFQQSYSAFTRLTFSLSAGIPDDMPFFLSAFPLWLFHILDITYQTNYYISSFSFPFGKEI